jgi:hypothetical protein
MLLFGIGMGLVFVPLTTASLAGVRPEDSGAASSMVNVMQQVGGSLGLAILVAVFGTAYRDDLPRTAAGSAAGTSVRAVAAQHQALVHGMSTAFGLAAIFDVAAFLIIVTLIRTRSARPVPAPRPQIVPAIQPEDADSPL